MRRTRRLLVFALAAAAAAARGRRPSPEDLA